ncbi:hypothetical protein J4E89_002508 [Alternaria sp. Ai002NY15]|nr:hypothetical protein J4E89_002508 [Alternaria sp. Ai002NY15]
MAFRFLDLSSDLLGSDFNIIPVLKLKASHLALDCKMVPATIENDSDLEQNHMRFWAVNQARSLNALVVHANEKWLEDISNGTIGEVLITSNTSFVGNRFICVGFTGVRASRNYREAISAPVFASHLNRYIRIPILIREHAHFTATVKETCNPLLDLPHSHDGFPLPRSYTRTA